MTVAAWDLGNTIRSSRIKKGYTQEALSELLDITPSQCRFLRIKLMPNI